MPAETKTRAAGRNGLVRRMLITLAAVAAYRVSLLITTPGVDSGVLAEYFGGSVAAEGLARLGHAGPFRASVIPPRALMSYMGAAVLVLLASALIPALRRLREGTPADHALFDRLIVGLALLFAVAQGLATAYFLESVTGASSGRPAVPGSGWGFRLVCMVTAAGGTAIVVWLAHAISQWGLGNGVAILLVAELLTGLAGVAGEEFRAVAAGATTLRHGLYGVVALVLAAAAAVVATRAVRRLPLVQLAQSGRSGAEAAGAAGAPAIRLRLNATGVLPIRGTQTIIPTLTANRTLVLAFLGVPGLLLDFPPTSTGAIAVTIVAGGILVLALTHLYAFITLDPRDAVQRAGGLGYAVEGAASDQEAVSLVRRAQRGLATANGAYLFCVALAPWVLDRGVGVSPAVAAYCGTHMLVLAAVALQVARQARQELALSVARWKHSGPEPWVPAWSAQTELEVEIGREILEQAGVPAAVRLNRVVAATGTLSFWEVARPRWPGLTVHRRLGGGGAELLVPAEAVERAREALRDRGAGVGGRA